MVQAGAEVGGPLNWILIAGAMATSLLTLYVVVRVWSKAFWRPRADAPEGAMALAKPLALLPSDEYVEFDERDDVGKMPMSMLTPTLALVVVSLLMTVFAGPLLAVTDRAVTVVDFKTDRVFTGEEMRARAEHYRPQLAAYSRALEQVLEQTVARRVLYFLSAGESVDL